MKRVLKVLIVLTIILGLGLLALQVFLNRGLNPVVQKALPKLSESIGLDVGIDDVSLNLFGGSLNVKNVRVNNPEAFKDPTAFAVEKTVLDVGLRALTKGILEISEASVKNAKVTLVRNKAGDLNLQKIKEAIPEAAPTSEQSEAPEAPQTPSQPTEPTEIPKVQINALAFNTLFEFVDYKSTNTTPLRVGFDLEINARDIVTFGERPEAEWGVIQIGGSLKENPAAFATDITAKVAPLTDPIHASFTAQGNIMAINMRELGSLASEAGVASSSASIAIQLTVRNGQFLSGSELVLSMRDAELVGKLKEKHKGLKLPPDLSITIPVSGSLEGPVISMQQAITTSILRNLSKNPDYLLDNVTVDGKSLRERLNKALGGQDSKKDDGDKKTDEVDDTVNDALKKLGGLFN